MANGTMMFEEHLATLLQFIERGVGERRRGSGRERFCQKPHRRRGELGLFESRDVLEKAGFGGGGYLRMTDKRAERLRLECRLATIQLVGSGERCIHHGGSRAPY